MLKELIPDYKMRTSCNFEKSILFQQVKKTNYPEVNISKYELQMKFSKMQSKSVHTALFTTVV